MTTLTAHQFTLTRWHKIVERLNAAVTEANGIAQKRFLSTTFNVTTKTAYTDEIVARYAQEGSQAIQTIENLIQDVARIRAAIAEANTKTGISEKLTRIDVTQREMTFLKALENANEGKVSFQVFQSIDVEQFANENSYGGRNTTIGIALLSDEALQSIKEKIAAHKRTINRLSDEIADANRTKIGIELSADAVTAASIAD